MPYLFRSADTASLKAQRTYLWLIRADLGLLAGAAALSSVSISDNDVKVALAAFSVVLIAGGLLLSFILKTMQHRKTWYGARAIAESTKTITWKYITGAEPFKLDLPDRDADRLFQSELAELMRTHEDIFAQLGSPDRPLESGSTHQLTARMREIRSLDTATRKSIYLSNRLLEQRNWYMQKANWHYGQEQLWFWLVMATQLLAMVSAILLVLWPTSPLTPTGLLTTVASAFLAWLEVRQHQDLAKAYNITMNELTLIGDHAIHVTTDKELSDFVNNAENTISHEHKLWIARRNPNLLVGGPLTVNPKDTP